jgi:hypothetical protein
MSSSSFRIKKTATTATTTAIAAATTATIAATTTTIASTTTATTTTTMGSMESSTKKHRKRSRAKRDKHRARGLDLGYVEAATNKEQKAQLEAAQREAAAAHAAAQRSEQQRKWAVEAGTADLMAKMRMERDLKETEDVALCALEAYERADKQRTELYYQAKSSNALAAKTLMESLGGAGGERCKALAKQRKVQVVEQAKSLRLTVKPHLTAAIQGHLPFLRK